MKLVESKAVTLIFPHQLFKIHPAIATGRKIFLIEEWLYFNQMQFIKQKLVLHRAGMQYYKARLAEYDVTYVEATEPVCDVRILIKFLATKGVQELHFAEVSDYLLDRRITKAAMQNGLKVVKYSSPNFLNERADVDDYFNERKGYFMTDFYKWQRKKRGILITANNQPAGGKWSFDHDNREKIPKGQSVADITFPEENIFVLEARAYVEKNFPDNYGTTEDFDNKKGSFFPVTHKDAETWLQTFLAERLPSFGVYEDAMVANEHFLYHGVLTPMLNTGLLNPQQIINAAIAAATEQEIPLNSLEGFIRQVMGWREYIHIVYMREGSRQRTKNYWGFTRRVPKSFWTATTGIVPVDKVISKVLKVGYCHHIERLMVMGNFM
ncbi:MAG TPA: cryptochrome/photolyase family protein, partial [Segetibacter sp.]